MVVAEAPASTASSGVIPERWRWAVRLVQTLLVVVVARNEIRFEPGTENRFYRLLGNTSTLVAVINAALAGGVGGLVAKAAGAGSELSLFIGAVVTTVLVVSLVKTSRRLIDDGRRSLKPRFARQVETARRHG